MSKFFNISIDRIFEFGFYLLFFLTPLLLTTINYELFEFNKIIFVYLITLILLFFWFLKIFQQNKIELRKTPLDFALFLFLFFQAISTVFSLDRYTSFWGYYTRFHGGFLSTICYITLYYLFVNNFPNAKIYRLINSILASGIIVSIYGLLQIVGIDKNLWVQDVQNRVFSTLGQPNWLAAYLNILVFLSLGLGLSRYLKLKQIISSTVISPFIYLYLLPLLYYLVLIFTKSRSGFISFWLVLFVFYFFILLKDFIKVVKPLSFLLFLFIIITFFTNTPFANFNKYTYQGFLKYRQERNPSIIEKRAPLDTGITSSQDIRKIVWQGSWEIFKQYPLFGSGVESFAYSYYLHRPKFHNLTSEWDFLYNKAHNEYLNFLSNTGAFGLFSYLFLVIFFLYLFFRFLFKKNSDFYFLIGLLSSFITILITNFFGFSVVVIALFFFLIPGIVFLQLPNPQNYVSAHNKIPKTNHPLFRNIFPIILITLFIYLLFYLGKIWIADYYFAKGGQESKNIQYLKAFQAYQTAVTINPAVPLYHSELSLISSQLAVVYFQNNLKKQANQLVKQALLENNHALELSPNNVNFFKTSVKMYFELSTLDEKYLFSALETLKIAKKLSPTDPKIDYNLGILYGRTNQNEQAIISFKNAALLKPNFKDAYFALALFYEQQGEIDKAKRHLKEILIKIDPKDTQVYKKLQQLEKL